MERGWTGVSDHIYSNKGNADDAYLILNLDVRSGFVGEVEYVDGQALPVATVAFDFDTLCSEQCTFMFMQVSSGPHTHTHTHTHARTHARTHACARAPRPTPPAPANHRPPNVLVFQSDQLVSFSGSLPVSVS